MPTASSTSRTATSWTTAASTTANGPPTNRNTSPNTRTREGPPAMPGFLKNRFVWIVIALVVIGGGGFAFVNNQAKAKKAHEVQAAATAAPSPYVAIANGKADVEGGVIQVAARTAGVIRDVYVHEGDQ